MKVSTPEPEFLTPGSLTEPGERPFGVYVHVPYCRVRCGYCDFNTYTAAELGGGASQASYAATLCDEIELAAQRWQHPPEIDTIFFGGGTPTLLPAGDLISILDDLRSHFGFSPSAEISIEANPESVSAQGLIDLRRGGFNRISFGMQSAVPHVLAALDRTHDPVRVPVAVQWAREAGFEQISVDLIYGTPGESIADWAQSLDAAIALEPDHISAYALIVEAGTALARQVRRGEVVMPDDDETADKYVLADEMLQQAGFSWYELSNWSRTEAAQCRHNMLYWTGANWWGFGPGAHSHYDGRRWWNIKHPRPYGAAVATERLPVAGYETLDAKSRRLERVLLESRLRSGLQPSVLDSPGIQRIPALVERGLLEPNTKRLILTRKGRLLADAVVHELT